MSLLAQLKATQVSAPAAAPAPQQAPRPMAPAPQAPPAQNPYQPNQAQPSQAERLAAYSGVSTAEGRKPKLPIGTHVLKIVQCRDGNFPEAIGGNFFFAADFTIQESSNPEALAGQEGSWLTSKGKYPQYFRADIKSFLVAVTNRNDGFITDQTPL
jgi:hypothetical protein